jgi:LPXTG-motif cell wall-anchored protein
VSRSRPFRRVAQALVVPSAVLAAAPLWLAPAPARADDPLRLGEQLIDRSGVLGDRRPQAEAVLRDLRDRTRLQLFVVFVHTFDGARAQQWADETAQRSDLGDRDALLAVATRDRAYAYAVDPNFPLTDAQLDEVAAKAIEPPLASNDWAGAVVGAANGYQAALNGQPVTTPAITPGRPDTGGGVPVAGIAVGVLVVAVLGLGGWLWWRRRRRPAVATAPGGLSTEELAARANALLVELDDELRTSERELSLAAGEYGAEATASFAAALDSARQEVTEAFRLRMTLDEAAPRQPDEPARRQVLTEIIQRCTAADERLDAEAAAFDALRELETHVEQTAAELGRRRAAAQERLPAAESTLAGLRGKYAGEAPAAVSGNVTQARERLDFAGSALDRAAGSVANRRRPAAALAVRAAEEALSQAGTLLDAVDRVAADLTAARAAVDSLLVEVEADLAEARTAQAGGAPAAAGAALTAAISGAEQALASVRTMLAAPATDPLAAVRLLQEADGALDRALAGARDATERTARARAMLDQALATARSEVATANEYITTRRGAVASQARTWLAEAQRRLATAESLAATDPVAALAEAQQASQWAGQARRAALADVDAWSPPGGGFAGGGSDALAGLAGAILGGILVGGGGPGYRRSRYGGGWGAWGGNGFGGSGTRSRRSGGGGFGGGRSWRGGGGRF